MNLIRRTRGVLRTAGVWAAAWSVPGFVWMSIFAYRSSFDRFDLLGFAWSILLNWTAAGAICGSLFALTLSVAERRQSSLAGLSMRRVATWGAIGGALLPLALFPMYPASLPNPLRQLEVTMVIFGILGAASAVASLHLARREPLPLIADRLGT